LGVGLHPETKGDLFFKPMNRIIVAKSKDFTVMSNHHLKNKELSLKAKGLQSFMLSLPDNWDLSISGLTACLKEGKESIYSAMNELEECGYIQKVELRESGKYVGIDYNVFEIPENIDSSPERQKPDTVKPDTENPPQINTKGNNILTNKEPTWRTDKDLYLNTLREEYINIMADNEFIEKWEEYYPNINVKMSIKKACETYWATDEGWNHKRRSKVKEINWKSTFGKSLSMSMNRIYKPKNQKNDSNS
jgi:hypothetical protein